MTSNNTITIRRCIDGYEVRAVARYDEADDGWICNVYEGNHGAPPVDTRNVDQTGNDVWATLVDMIDFALSDARARDREIAGPFSNAQAAS